MVRGIYDFLALEEIEQYTYVWAHGTFLTVRTCEGIAFALNACCDFYVEIKYSRSANRVEGIRVFKSISQREPYLDSIALKCNGTGT